MPKYATVALDISVAKSFDYLIPRNLEDSVKPGLRVYVPFRSGRRLAYVIALSDGTAYPGAKAIISVRDREPVLSESMLRLAESSVEVANISTELGDALRDDVAFAPCRRFGKRVCIAYRGVPDLDQYSIRRVVCGETVLFSCGVGQRRAPNESPDRVSGQFLVVF